MRNAIVLAGLVVLGIGCKKAPTNEVDVECGMDVATARSCTVKHVSGKVPLRVCWSIFLGCRDGREAQAERCEENLRPGDQKTHSFRRADFTGFNNCDPISTSMSPINVDFVKASAPAAHLPPEGKVP